MLRRQYLSKLLGLSLALVFALTPAAVLAGDPIDVGAAATDRSYHRQLDAKTIIEGSNTANDDGSIDTVECYFLSGYSVGDVWAGTFSKDGSTFTCRDSESLGSLSVGSKQTITGLDIEISSGDYIGAYDKTPGEFNTYLEVDYSGGTAIWYYDGECIDADDSAAFSELSSWQASLYGTGETSEPDIGNAPSSESLGTVSVGSTYYADGSAPSNPVTDSDCTFTVTNNSGAAVDIDIKATDWTGGVGWTLTSNSPGEDEVRMTAYYSGQNPANGVVLTTSNQSFISNLADSGTKKWDFKVETGTFTDGVQKETTITLTATFA